MATGDPDPETGQDIGHGHTLRYYGWYPDRHLNPGLEAFPDCDRAVAEVRHPRLDGTGPCVSAATLDTAPEPVTRNGHTWHVESWEPLTLSPSLLCTACGDHGFIREGRWIPA